MQDSCCSYRRTVVCSRDWSLCASEPPGANMISGGKFPSLRGWTAEGGWPQRSYGEYHWTPFGTATAGRRRRTPPRLVGVGGQTRLPALSPYRCLTIRLASCAAANGMARRLRRGHHQRFTPRHSLRRGGRRAFPWTSTCTPLPHQSLRSFLPGNAFVAPGLLLLYGVLYRATSGTPSRCLPPPAPRCLLLPTHCVVTVRLVRSLAAPLLRNTGGEAVL
jgi:hypothetical protein